MSLFHIGFWDEARWPTDRRNHCLEWLSRQPLLPEEEAVSADIDPAKPRSLLVVDVSLTLEPNWRQMAEQASAVLVWGKRGLPSQWTKLGLPFEKKGLRTTWLRHLLELGRSWSKEVRLIHCHDGIIAREVVKLAEWFRLETLNHDFEVWLEEGVRQSLKNIVDDFPEAEIHSVVGPWSRALTAEDFETTLLASHIGFDGLGFMHHHGIPLERLIKEMPFSWFIWLA